MLRTWNICWWYLQSKKEVCCSEPCEDGLYVGFFSPAKLEQSGRLFHTIFFVWWRLKKKIKKRKENQNSVLPTKETLGLLCSCLWIEFLSSWKLVLQWYLRFLPEALQQKLFKNTDKQVKIAAQNDVELQLPTVWLIGSANIIVRVGKQFWGNIEKPLATELGGGVWRFP